MSQNIHEFCVACGDERLPHHTERFHSADGGAWVTTMAMARMIQDFRSAAVPPAVSPLSAEDRKLFERVATGGESCVEGGYPGVQYNADTVAQLSRALRRVLSALSAPAVSPRSAEASDA